jgi:hypothetical protein
MNASPEIRKLFLEKFEKGEIILSDPGKRSIMYMLSSGKETNISYKEMKKLKKESPNEGKLNELIEQIRQIMGSNLNLKTKKNKIRKLKYNYKMKLKRASNFGINMYKGHKILNYTSGTRSKFTGRNKHALLVNNWKNRLNKKTIPKDINLNELVWWKKTLQTIETELSYFDSKSCDHNKFMKYVKKKIEYLKKFELQYKQKFLHKLKWQEHINTIRHESTLIEQIKETFGKDIIIIMGDWSGSGNVNYRSTPNIAIKRKLSEHFKVFLIDEYLTSKIHHKSLGRCSNLHVPLTTIKNKLPNTKNKKSNTNYMQINTKISKPIKKIYNKNAIDMIETETLINIKDSCVIRGPHKKKFSHQMLNELNNTTPKIDPLLINGTECLLGLKDDMKTSMILKKTSSVLSTVTLTPNLFQSSIPLVEPIKKKLKYNTKKVHAVLTYKFVITEVASTSIVSGCINRDLSATLSDNTILYSYLTTGERHIAYRRGTPPIIPDPNQDNVQLDKPKIRFFRDGNLLDPVKVLRDSNDTKSCAECPRPSKKLLRLKNPKNIKGRVQISENIIM